MLVGYNSIIQEFGFTDFSRTFESANIFSS